MSKSPFQNRWNDLSPKEWLKFQKSFMLHNPPPRRKDVLFHPAKFPETLARQFIEFFTHAGQNVLDPMAGTGSALVAALRSGRNSYGIELQAKYAEVGRRWIDEERTSLGELAHGLLAQLITGDAAHLSDLLLANQFPQMDYVISSPPYWNMLHAKGAVTQQHRRESAGLDVHYSDDPADLGNITNYDEFIERLGLIYASLQPFLRSGAYLTVIVKNVKKGGLVYPLAWDLARYLSQTYELRDEKLWLQDNQALFPYGMGYTWVSNTFHHYCLQFRNAV